MRLAIILVLVTLPTANDAMAQCVPIAELAAAPRSVPLDMVVTNEILETTLDEVIAAGEIAIEGTVQPIRTYLSDDGCAVYTDYSVNVTSVFFGKLPTRPQPDAPQLVVTTRGGDVNVNGTNVRFRDQQLSPLPPGNI